MKKLIALLGQGTLYHPKKESMKLRRGLRYNVLRQIKRDMMIGGVTLDISTILDLHTQGKRNIETTDPIHLVKNTGALHPVEGTLVSPTGTQYLNDLAVIRRAASINSQAVKSLALERSLQVAVLL